ncbi:MAG: right-handed parallel beta-helix repeat-containing protein [Verrucomicrobia bacterium]|nr:right-handed parallel beta-helix repeat-containing protein [Verrucomicrobiota bacterium]
MRRISNWAAHACRLFTSRRVAVWTLLATWFAFAPGVGWGATYYLNDRSATGDVYTTAIGDDANSGLSNSAPKLTMTNLLATYSLAGGDAVYIDTGSYSNYSTVFSTSGSRTNYIRIIGSTNYAAGGSDFDRKNNGASVFSFGNNSFYHVTDIRVRGGQYGILVSGGSSNLFESVIAYSNTVGFFAAGGWNNRMLRSVAAFNQSGFLIPNTGPHFWDYGVSWSNGTAFALTLGSVSISNSVIVGGIAISGARNLFLSDSIHNVFWQTALPSYYDDISAAEADGRLFFSTVADPQFANPAALDFRPKSIVGRFDPASDTWVTDAVHSVLIDFASPSDPFASEPAPNGGVANVGSFGNHPQASMSRTNPWVYAISFNDGGNLVSSGALRWAYGGMSATSSVNLSYSSDAGATWGSIAVSVPVTNRMYVWDASAATSSLRGLWRITSSANTNVWDQNDRIFVVRASNTHAFALFVNDTSTVNDVYCMAPGSDLNTGLSPSMPRLNPQSVFDDYDLGGGDVVYIDTGLYTTTITVRASNRGLAGRPLQVLGSTNIAATIIAPSMGNVDGIVLGSGVNSVSVQDFQIENARYGAYLSSASSNELVRLRIFGSTEGVRFLASSQNRISQALLVGNQYGVRTEANSRDNSMDSSTVWSNLSAFGFSANSALSISNSILGGRGTIFGTSIYATNWSYNVLWAATIGASIPNLFELQKNAGQAPFTTFADPLFADVGNRDYHLKSVAGRWDPVAQAIVTDAVHSVAIDFGDPARDFSLEPMPNGARINVGIHGNTVEASRGRTNSWLQTISLNDGGLFSVGDILTWIGGSFPSNATVRIEFSGDEGQSWEVVATNIAAAAGTYVWSNTNLPSSYFSRWQVVLEQNPSVSSANSSNFTFRNGVFRYYLNDSGQEGDVFTTAVGNDANRGTTPATPKANLATLLDEVDLDPGDVVYVDTGVYRSTVIPQIGSADSGDATNPVYFVFSTNMAAGGAVLDRLSRAPTAVGLRFLSGASHVVVENMVVTNAGTGVSIASATNLTFRNAAVRFSGDSGFSLSGADTIHLQNSVISLSSTNGLKSSSSRQVMLTDSILWRNRDAQIRVDGGNVAVTGSILVASGPRAIIYGAGSATNIFSDFNGLFAESNASIARIDSIPGLANHVGAWHYYSGQDLNSVAGDPLFADPVRGDFHLRSEILGGRFDPFANAWVNDPVHSPLIDAGKPSRPSSNEPLPNGGRINIGLYANSAEASLGRSAPWLLAASHRQGGWVKGTATLHWVAGNMPSGALVRVDYSPNGGETWSAISTGVLASSELVTWNTLSVSNTAAALWRVVSIDDPSVSSSATNVFAIRNGSMTFYLNDESTVGDNYSTGPGAATNWVATAARPFNSLSRFAALYDVEPGDVVYVDAGLYSETAPVEFSPVSSGISNSFVQIVGPTNGLAARISRSYSPNGNTALSMSYASWMAVSNLTFQEATIGVRVADSTDLNLSLAASANRSNGIEVLRSTNIVFRRAIADRNGWRGLYLMTNPLVRVESSVVWSNAGGGIQFRAGDLHVSNSVLQTTASGTFLFIIDQTNSVMKSDYNDLFAPGSGQVGLRAGVAYRTLLSWQAAMGLDDASLSHDPLFANPDNGDYHVLSQAGRYLPGGGWTNDAATSSLVDTADPLSPFAAEPTPNGARRNLGIFGNHDQASKSPTNARLLAVSHNDGGFVRGTNQLSWIAFGAATNHTVRLDFSADGGVTWTTVVAGINAALGVYTNWDTTVHGSTILGNWRVVSESDTNVYDTVDNLFTVNNGALTYYVNDESTDGDVYSQAAGSEFNDGASPATPALSVQQILDRYVLTPGDQIWVDTGIYPLSSPVVFGQSVVGLATNRIVLQGSTNFAAGGTIFDGQRSNRVIVVQNTVGIELRDLTVQNGYSGLYLSYATNVVVDNVSVIGRKNVNGESLGIESVFSVNATIRRTSISGVTNAAGKSAALAMDSSSGFQWIDGVLWSNRLGISLSLSSIQVSNSIFAALEEGGRIYTIGRGSSVEGDYNNYFLTNGASIGVSYHPLFEQILDIPTIYDTLSSWVRLTGNDTHSLSHDPLFANPEAEDYHLKSVAGRFQPGTGWVNDIESSPLLDAGPPLWSYANESSPNGVRRNIGRYGDTAEASRTPTGSRLTALTYNDGGLASGTNVTLRWLSGGPVTNHLLRVDISYDNGLSWSGSVFNIPAGNTLAQWDSTSWLSLPNIRWRVQSQSDTNIVDANDRWFQIRNSNLVYYVNDASTNGDVYTSRAGFETYSGRTTNEPLPHLVDVLERYDLEPGDWVYVDTGNYPARQTAIITSLDSGDQGTNWVTIVGSTNGLEGGTVFNSEIRLEGAREVRVENIAIANTGARRAVALHIVSSSNLQVRSSRSSGAWGNAFVARESGNILFDRSIAQGASTNGLFDERSFGVVWGNGVLWSNRVGVRSESQPGVGNALIVSNSILGALNDEQVAISSGSNLVSDFNAIFVTNGASVALQGVHGLLYPIRYDSVGRWALSVDRDHHSLAVDPMFVLPGADFHLKSAAGRYNVASNGFVQDTMTSWLIDAADPSNSFTNEPDPNGSRRNIGAFGDTLEASKSPTNAALLAVTLRDGGIAVGISQPLYWIARGAATGHTVRVEYSPDNGLSWTTLAVGVSASAGSISWNTTSTPSTVLGAWRVVSEVETNVIGQSQAPFAVRNGPIAFFVNDSATNGDVYCTAPGSSSNLGVSPAAPMLSLQKLLDTYDLEAGDTVYVDTGTYSNPAPIKVAQGDSGTLSPFVPVRIVGSTNYPAGGSVFVATVNDAATFDFFDVRAFELRDMTLRGGASGTRVTMKDSEGLRFERIHTEGGQNGFSGAATKDVQWRNSIARNYSNAGLTFSQGSALVWDAGVMWSVGTNAVVLSQSALSISNSSFTVTASNGLVYVMDEGSTLSANYNNYWMTNGATMARRSSVLPDQFPMRWESVSRWARDTGLDRFSLSVDPQFYDPENGDFHLKSVAGRYDVGTGAFVNDTETSPLIDAGSYLAAFSKETPPNGGRINIGAYGNTPWASRTPTNARLQVVSLNDGGRAEGVAQTLYWIASGVATGHTIRVELSTDNGTSWSVLQSNLPARIFSPLFWDTTATNSTPVAWWRVVSEVDSLIVSSSSKPFAIRNEPLSFYVNDASTAGDVYTLQAGSPFQHGGTPDQPRNSVQSILDDYDLEPGDTLYVDTGTYPLTGAGIRWGQFDAWDAMTNTTPLVSGVSVILQGSTNYVDGGSQFTAYQVDPAFYFDRALGVSVRDLVVRQLLPSQATGIHFFESPFAKVYRVETRHGGTGFSVDNSPSVTFSNSIARGNSRDGLRVIESGAVNWYNGLLWSNRYGVYQRDVAPNELRVENTAIGVWGNGSYAYYSDTTPNRLSGSLLTDYNGVFRDNGAFVAAVISPTMQGGGTTRYDNVTSWMQATGNDKNTVVGDPLFAGPDDFHLQSYAGRFELGVGFVTNMGDGFSPLIDAGRPGAPFARESAPNGGRVNIGPHGNHAEASLTPTTNGGLKTITFNDGGSALGEIELRWVATGVATGHLVRIEFSSNGGGSWTMVHTGIAASAGSYIWDSVPYGRAAAGLWRITSVDNGQISDISDKFFALRNGGSIPYYVNDNSTVGDVYCSAPGNDLYDGYLPSTPKATLQGLLDAIDLEPGDIVYVDTGTYLLSSKVTVGDLDSGTADQPVVIQGSTNFVAGGTLFNRQAGAGTAIELFQTKGIRVRDLQVMNAGVGLALVQAESVIVENVRSENNSISSFSTDQVTSSAFVRCIAYLATNGLTTTKGMPQWNNGVIYGVERPFYLLEGGSVDINSSYTRAVGPESRIFYATMSAGQILGDYNAYERAEGALMFEKERQTGGNELLPRLADWQAAYGQDLHSFVLDPLMVNPAAGDFTPRSGTGRFLADGTLTNDPGVYSPLLDTGNPAFAWTNELAPNGSRINIGHLGNTPRASLSQTNPWLLALSFNDGATLKGTTTVYWASGGMTNGTRVRLEYALDGVDFLPFATNILASQGFATWDVSALPVSYLARWRVKCESCAAESQNQFPLTIKNYTLTIYVNDTSTNGDVYATAPGSPTNTGLSANSPLNSPEAAFGRYTLGPEDVVYIDTGIYSLTNDAGMYIGLSESVMEFGISNYPIRVLGSTNTQAGGTLIIGTGGTNSYGLQIRNSSYVEVENIRITDAGYAILAYSSPNVTLRNIEAFANAVDGILVNNAQPMRVEHARLWGNGRAGLTAMDKASVELARSVFWSNHFSALYMSDGSVSISNSIAVANTTNSYVYRLLGLQSSLRGDYNMVWATNGAELAFDQTRQVHYRTLRAIQGAFNSHEHAALQYPHFALPEEGDFHLRSEAGRLEGTNWVLDTSTSWAIDAGSPVASYDQEPVPNGDRMNIGVYANTPDASKSVTNPALRELQIVSFDDGGLMPGPQYLRWFARGYTPDDRVTIAFSPNAGMTWIVIATNVPARDGEFYWSPDPTNSSPITLWKITAETGAPESVTNSKYFALRLMPIKFYVNDGSLVGDVYTYAIGSPTNDGLSPLAPLDSLATVVSLYDLEGGDQVLVDTGYYMETNTVALRAISSGNASSRVYITGSTNRLDGGTILNHASVNMGSLTNVDPVFDIYYASDIDISHLTLVSANVAVATFRADGIVLSNLVVRDIGSKGMSFREASEASIRHSLITGVNGVGVEVNSSMLAFDSGVIWSNAGSALAIPMGNARVTNSVLHATGTNFAYVVGELATVRANFNNLFLEGGARPARVGVLDMEGVLQWSLFSGNDTHSLSVDPLFSDPSQMDFHLLSPMGRFNPLLDQFETNDLVFSPLVDTGPSLYPYALEPEPNGGRRNIGLYGNTAFASKGRTNAWLMALTGSSGGRGNGLIPLTWAWGQMAPTNRVSLDFSYDNGTNWVRVTSNQLVSTESYLWESLLTPFSVTPIARYRVVLDANTNVWDMTDTHFALNGPFSFYLNDGSLDDDVFTTAVGSDSNLGFYPNAPMLTLQALLDTWDLDPGDAVYIDTGVYPIDTNTITTIPPSDSGSAGTPVFFTASSNEIGSRFDWIGPYGQRPAILQAEGPYVVLDGLRFREGGLKSTATNQVLQNLIFTNADIEVAGIDTTASNIVVDVGDYKASGANQAHSRILIRNGVIQISGTDILLENSLAYGTQSVAAVASGTNIVLINNTFVSARDGVVLSGGDASLTLRNNTIIGNGLNGEAHVIRIESGALDSDYNNLVARNGAWIGNANGKWERLLYWQAASGHDPNSISADPMFANEGGSDFHPKSKVGRWTPGGIVTDSVHAATIDMGAPYLPFSAESLPHGSRVNIGAYGNTEQASRSLVDPWLFAMTMNDGGVFKGTNVLRWGSGNLTNGATVSLRYSPNQGLTWTTVATGISAAAGQYTWDSTLVPSSLKAYWEVVLDGNTNVRDRVDTLFALRNVPLNFYVNDTSTVNDVYTTAPGAATNSGLTAGTPINTLSGLLALYDTEGGDVIYVDTGYYPLTQNVTVIWSRGGDPTNGPLWIWGSTNFVAGGSVFSRGSFLEGAASLDIKASHVRARNLTLQQGRLGALLDSNTFVTVERSRSVSNHIGIAARNAFRPVIQNSIFAYNASNAVELASSVSNAVQNNVFYDNPVSAIAMISNASPNLLQNNIFSLGDVGAVAYTGVFNVAFVDYNVYQYRTNNVRIFGAETNLLRWQLQTERDYRSAITNPLFASPASGDFHLRSTLGRWADGTGFVTDAQSSWAIDRGSTNSAYVLEPMPNGARINIGAYGNTEYASKGLVNTQVLVETRILNTPTFISETNATWPLIWGTINIPSNELFRVEFSGDGGTNWYTLSNNVPAYQEYIVWNASPFFNTYKGRWRVVGENNTNYWDVNDAQFNLFFGTFRVYQVFNDQITNGIVFRGAWAEQYQVQWASNVVSSNLVWHNAATGPGPQEKASFLSTNGGDFIYRDIESVTNRYRLYRVMRQ